ncbi:MAG: LPXTG cell wall anchor domain-containing protein [Candidatus Woykebacteria bacterium]
MVKKLLVIGLTFVIVLLVSSSPALAHSRGGNSHEYKSYGKKTIQISKHKKQGKYHSTYKHKSKKYSYSHEDKKDNNHKYPVEKKHYSKVEKEKDKKVHGKDKQNVSCRTKTYVKKHRKETPKKEKPEDPKIEKKVKKTESKVLGATTLPETGPTSNSYVYIPLGLLLGGSALYVVTRRLEKVEVAK